MSIIPFPRDTEFTVLACAAPGFPRGVEQLCGRLVKGLVGVGYCTRYVSAQELLLRWVGGYSRGSRNRSDRAVSRRRRHDQRTHRMGGDRSADECALVPWNLPQLSPSLTPVHPAPWVPKDGVVGFAGPRVSDGTWKGLCCKLGTRCSRGAVRAGMGPPGPRTVPVARARLSSNLKWARNASGTS